VLLCEKNDNFRNMRVCSVLCLCFLQGLEKVLQSSTDGLLVLNVKILSFSLRAKLAAVVVNHAIQERGLQ
jgi:hypothetical protein